MISAKRISGLRANGQRLCVGVIMQKGRTVGGGGQIEEISGICRFVGAYLLLASECMIVDTARNEKYKIRVSERFALTNRPSLQRGRGGKGTVPIPRVKKY